MNKLFWLGLLALLCIPPATVVIKRRLSRLYRLPGSPKLKRVKWVVAAVVLILIGILIWANFFYYKDCENQTCFNDYLVDCHRARFTLTGDMIFEYKIEGENEENCFVNVKLLQGESNDPDSLKLEGKQMECNVPLGTIIAPESDINNCHGLLKEGLQDLIISKLHRYIVQNLGEINAEI